MTLSNPGLAGKAFLHFRNNLKPPPSRNTFEFLDNFSSSTIKNKNTALSFLINSSDANLFVKVKVQIFEETQKNLKKSLTNNVELGFFFWRSQNIPCGLSIKDNQSFIH